MANEKTANTYTPEQTQHIIAAYAAGQTADEIAAAVNRSRRSVIAKLAHEGVYQAEPHAPRRQKKSELVEAIATNLGVEASILSSLEKATHEALVAVAARVAPAGEVLGSEI
jgi:hypothetical protein